MYTISQLTNAPGQIYGMQEVKLHQLNSETGKCIYRIEQEGKPSWVLRVYPQGQKDTVLSALVNVLLFLEGQEYPAERVVRTIKQDMIATCDEWQLLMTTFIEGNQTDFSPSRLHLFGTTLGRLHALYPSVSSYTLPAATMLPARELAYALEQLTCVASSVPVRLAKQYDVLITAISAIKHCEDMPAVLIHNDCHPANSVYTSTGQVILIDWEGAGIGPAVIDVGFLLANCDGATPWSPLPQMGTLHIAAEKIATVVDGYCQHHLLTVAELDRLPDAIRFRSLVYGACHFAAAIADHEEPEPQWWWVRYTAADEIAEEARRYFERYLP